MRKLIKFLLILIAVVVLLVVVAALVLPQFIDPNDYKPEISEAVKSQIGRDIDIAGDLNLSVFPWIGVKTGKISLSNAAGFGDAPFAKIDETQVKIKLIPLLSKTVEVKRIVLKGLELNLAKNKQGISNWDDLLSKSADKDKEKAPEKESDSDTSVIDLATIALGGVNIEDANITWDDKQTGQHVKVAGFNFFLDQLRFDEPVDFDLKFSVDNREPKITELVDLSGNITINKALDNFVLSAIKLHSNTRGSSIPGESLDTKLELNAKVDLKNQTANFDSVKLILKELTVLADLTGSQILDAPEITGRVNIPQFSPRKLMKELAMEVPPTADGDVLKQFAATFQLAATANSVALNNIDLKLDDTSISGQTKVINFSQPAITFNFDIDDINADRYLPPKSEKSESTPAATPATAAGKATTELPLDTLRKLNANGTIKIGQLKINGAKAKGIEVNVRGKNGIIQSKQTINSLYQGNYHGNFKLDARGNVAKISLNETLSNINVEPLLMDTTGKSQISGTAQLKAQLTGRGIDPDSLKKSLNGTIDALFTDGAVKGINIIKMVRDVRTALKGNVDNASNENDKTEFSELKFAAKVDNGVVNNHELSVKSPFLRVNGSGNVNLANENIDYQIIAKLVSSLDGQGGTDIKELSGVPVAIDITGTLSDLAYKPNLEAMLQEKQKALIEEKKKKLEAKIDEKKQELIEKLDKKLGPDAGKLLDNLFGK